MKILMSSDGPIDHVKTGFARVMHKVARQLAVSGHQVDLICHNYDGPPVLNYQNYGYNVHRGSNDDFSAKEVAKFLSSRLIDKYDFFINVGDIWRISYNSLFRNGFDFLSLDFETTLWFFYAEIDGEGIHQFKLGKGYFETLTTPDTVVVPTKFASEFLEEAGIEHEVIPHTVDLKKFHPESKKIKQFQRQKMGFDEDDFIVGAVGVPARRKGWNEMLFAFRIFLDSLPKREREQVKLYAHTDVTCKIDQLDLPAWITMLDLNRNIVAPDLKLGQYVPDEEMRRIYSTFDCFLSCSKIEGFNIPLIEAEACGIPIIATNYASHPEIIENCGELIDVKNFTVNQSDIKMANIDPHHAASLLLEIYNSNSLRDKYGRAGPKRVKKLFSDKENEKWVKIIEEFESTSNIQRLVI